MRWDACISAFLPLVAGLEETRLGGPGQGERHCQRSCPRDTTGFDGVEGGELMTCVVPGNFWELDGGVGCVCGVCTRGTRQFNSARFLSTSMVPFTRELELAGALGEMGIDVR